MPTGTRIKEVRRNKGLTQKQLGEKCHIAESTIRRYESGNLNPKLETLQKIANALEVPLYDLLVSHEIEDLDGTATPVLKIDTEGFSMEEVKSALEEFSKKHKPSIITPHAEDIESQEPFLCFLEWLGYDLSVSNYAKMQETKIKPYSDDDYLIGIQDNIHDNVTFFHKKDFIVFQKSVAKAVDFEIYKHFNDPHYTI